MSNMDRAAPFDPEPLAWALHVLGEHVIAHGTQDDPWYLIANAVDDEDDEKLSVVLAAWVIRLMERGR